MTSKKIVGKRKIIFACNNLFFCFDVVVFLGSIAKFSELLYTNIGCVFLQVKNILPETFLLYILKGFHHGRR